MNFDNPADPGYKKPESTMRIMKFRFKGAARIVLAAILFFSIFRPPVSGQNTDPFYHKWLESGEASFLTRNFAQAVQSLEIAVFGLAREKEAQARGYVFLALSRAALGQAEPSAAALASAAGNVGWDGLKTMDLPGEARRELDKLLAKRPTAPPAPEKKKSEETKAPVEVISVPEKKPEEKPVGTTQAAAGTTQAGTRLESGTASIGDLREAIKADPRDAAAYYNLAFLYRQVRDYGNARETLGRLIKQNPAEILAHLEVGRIDYLSGNAKSAVKTLEKFLSLTKNVPVEERWLDEGAALLLLSAAARGDQKKVAKLLAEAESLFLPERLEKLTLDPADLEKLRALRKPAAK